MFKRNYRRQRLKKLIKNTEKLIFSDSIPISSDEEREIFLRKVARNSSNIDLLRIYLVIKSVAKFIIHSKPYPPFENDDIDGIIKKLDDVLYLSEFGDDVILTNIELSKIEAQWQLSLATHYFEIGREEYRKNPRSFEGLRYIKEKNRKKPLTLKEYEYLKKIGRKE